MCLVIFLSRNQLETLDMLQKRTCHSPDAYPEILPH